MKVRLEEAKNGGLTLKGWRKAKKETTSNREEQSAAPRGRDCEEHEAEDGGRARTLTKLCTPSKAGWDRRVVLTSHTETAAGRGIERRRRRHLEHADEHVDYGYLSGDATAMLL